MFSALFRRLAAPVAALALLVVAAPSRGDVLVKYYTTATFANVSNPGNVVVTNGAEPVFPGSGTVGDTAYNGVSSIQVDNPVDGFGSTLKYNFSGLREALIEEDGGFTALDTPGGLGSFQIASKDSVPDYDHFDGTTIALKIYVIDPVVGPTGPTSSGTLAATITGVVRLRSNGTPASGSPTLVVDFSANNVVNVPTGDPKFLFRVIGPTGNGAIEIGSGSGPTYLEGAVAAPLPGVATVGLPLLGAVGSLGGLRRLVRRRRSVAPAV